ncbi:hypothetical protein AND_007592 [Anopheles darlingi]|uniref:Uncharacterized protein n=1 Tax=Anopheles darlingi TaxID=43151 RepID=W5JCZ1_ANODA|nr:hypothetical protein AND_007592 [Anopheles darlingi]
MDRQPRSKMELVNKGHVRRGSWSFRIICLVPPLIIHLLSESALSYVHGKPTTPAMRPDICSVMFLIATSFTVSRFLEQNIRAHGDVMPVGIMDDADRMAAKLETRLIALVKILCNIIVCDLSLRLVWIPTQYALWWIYKKKVLLPQLVRTVAEVTFNLAVFEVVRYKLWHPMQMLACAGSKWIITSNLARDVGGGVLLETVLSSISILAFWYSAIGTGYSDRWLRSFGDSSSRTSTALHKPHLWIPDPSSSPPNRTPFLDSGSSNSSQQ